jgi:hypothetical protein
LHSQQNEINLSAAAAAAVDDDDDGDDDSEVTVSDRENCCFLILFRLILC